MSSLCWLPWGDDAFARCKPLLVVIGTSLSHACRVLDDESLDDPEVQQLIAARFTAVRVDADARPDLDARYQPPGQNESWPLVCVLSPAGELLTARTRLSRTAFRQLLVHPAQDGPSPSAQGRGNANVVDAIRAGFSPILGGFGPPPKLPHAPALDLLLALPDPWALPIVRRTLDALMEGGIHDQLGGGFHRDSTDEKWIVPHFEKRAADQAALLGTYLAAHARTGEARYLEVARGILRYLDRLAAPGGGWFAGEAADIGAYDDGSHYTWTVDEARAALLPDELAVAQRYWDIFGRGELHTDPTRNVLFVVASVAAIAEDLGQPAPRIAALVATARNKLLAARDARPRPALDRTLYVASNAHLARILVALPDQRAAALQALARLYAQALGPDGAVRHSLDDTRDDTRDDSRSVAWLDSHAQLALAALAAFDATGDSSHRAVAARIADHLLAQFAGDQGGFFDRPRDAGGRGQLAERVRPVRDGSAASGNALAGRLLHGLGRTDLARKLVDSLVALANEQGVRGAGLIELAHVLADR